MVKTLKVCETFPAIQGEGKTIGLPVYFLRLTYCNVHCPWCDTKYYSEGTDKTLNEVSDELTNSGFNDIIITGGEPMIQSENMFTMMSFNMKLRYHLETNGTFYDEKMSRFETISCSPKRFITDNESVSSKLTSLENITFKFVYEPGLDKWWESFVSKYNIPKDKVYIMPLGATRKEQEDNMPEVIEYALKNKFMFSTRIQVLAYDTKRGV